METKQIVKSCIYIPEGTTEPTINTKSELKQAFLRATGRQFPSYILVSFSNFGIIQRPPQNLRIRQNFQTKNCLFLGHIGVNI